MTAWGGNRVGWARRLGGLLLFLGMVAVGSGLWAASPAWVRLGTREGLPGTSVTSLLEDRQGFLWIGTLDGLVRLGSEEAEVILPSGPYLQREVRRIFQASDGVIWVARTHGALMQVQGREARLLGAHSGLPEDGTLAVTEDEAGRLVVAGRNSLYLKDQGGFRPLALPPGWGDRTPWALAAESGGLWLAERGGHVARWDGQGWQEEGLVWSEGILDLARGPDGRLWLLTRTGLWLRSGRTWQVTDLRGRRFTGAILGFGADGAPLVSDEGLGITTLDRMGAGVPVAHLPGVMGVGALMDRRNRLWVATLRGILVRHPGGIHRMDAEEAGAPGGLGSVWCLLPEGDGLLVGCHAGLFRWQEGQGWCRMPLPGERPWVMVLASDGRGGHWVGTQEGLFRIRQNRVEAVPVEGVRSVVSVMSWEGRVVLGTQDGMVFLDAEGRFLSRLRPPTGALGFVHGLALVRGQLMACGAMGLLRVEGAALKPAFANTPFAGAQIRTFQVAPDGRLWVASTVGVFREGPSGWERVDACWPEEDGKVVALAFLEGQAVLGHGRGFTWLRPEGAARVGWNQGLRGEDVRENALMVDGRGRLWVGTGEGLYRVDDPRALPADELPEPILEAHQALRLKPGQGRDLGFTVKVPYPLPPFPPLVRYVVEGLEGGEQYLGSRRDLRVAGLGPGRYVLRIKAGLGSGRWEEGAPVAIHILPAFHERLDIRILGGFALIAVAAWGWRRGVLRRLERSNARLSLEVARRTSSLSRRNLDLEEAHEQVKLALEARMRQTRSVVHDLRGPLTAISLVAQRLEAGEAVEGRYLEILGAETERLEALLRHLLDEARSQHLMPGVHLRPIQPWEVFEGLMDGLRVRAEAKGLVFRFQEAPGIGDLRVLGDPLALQQVLLNLVGNALKFTSQGTVEVHSWQVQGHWVLEVRDTGRGMEPEALERLFQPFTQVEAGDAAQGWGLGLSIVHGLVAQHGGRLEVDSHPGLGSVFRVWIPVIDASTSGLPPAPSRGDGP